MTKPFQPQIVSANDLLDGHVVYLDVTLQWTTSLSAAAVANSEEAAHQLLRVAGEHTAQIVDPYLVDVQLVDEGASQRPLHSREQLRVSGPSIVADYRSDTA